MEANLKLPIELGLKKFLLIFFRRLLIIFVVSLISFVALSGVYLISTSELNFQKVLIITLIISIFLILLLRRRWLEKMVNFSGINYFMNKLGVLPESPLTNIKELVKLRKLVKEGSITQSLNLETYKIILDSLKRENYKKSKVYNSFSKSIIFQQKNKKNLNEIICIINFDLAHNIEIEESMFIDSEPNMYLMDLESNLKIMASNRIDPIIIKSQNLVYLYFVHNSYPHIFLGKYHQSKTVEETDDPIEFINQHLKEFDVKLVDFKKSKRLKLISSKI